MGSPLCCEDFFTTNRIKMKGNESLKKVVHEAIKCEPELNAAETSADTKFGRYLKRFIFLASLAGIGLFLNSCMAGYVASEPAYTVYERPPQPSNLHVWIDGDWGWNYQSHTYVQRAGYWEQPRQGRTYVSGYWQSTPRGKSWSKGHWQSAAPQSGKHNRGLH
jgi:hypothetical protein